MLENVWTQGTHIGGNKLFTYIGSGNSFTISFGDPAVEAEGGPAAAAADGEDCGETEGGQPGEDAGLAAQVPVVPALAPPALALTHNCQVVATEPASLQSNTINIGLTVLSVFHQQNCDTYIHTEVQLIILAVHVGVHPLAVQVAAAKHPILLSPPVVLIEAPVPAMMVTSEPDSFVPKMGLAFR